MPFDTYLSWGLVVSVTAEEAAVIFGEAAALCIQKQYLHHGLASQSMLTLNEDCNLVYCRIFSSEYFSPRQLKLMQGNNIRDSGNSHVIFLEEFLVSLYMAVVNL